MIRCGDLWQGPSDATCSDDLLVLRCDRLAGHDGKHRAEHPDTGERVGWYRGTGDLYAHHGGGIIQRQFTDRLS